jgi:serine/threonine protein kinase/tetratricopeptide (TPR) repeat protein
MVSSQLDEKAIFNVARKIDSPEAQAEYLHQVSGDNPGLIDRVSALLRGFEKQIDFLESPAPGSVTAAIAPPITERPGTLIGPYKLLEQIGEGGFGVVYMAEQTEPVRRRVALKIIKPGMDTKEVIARFEAERQALALMNHPSVAKMLDAGETESGRPYFVMDLVHGVPITEFCDEQKLPTGERLRLFVDVCRAIQHAHQKGVIHRDLKPSNVMVTMHDDKAVPKVIDFGVAKALSEQLTEKTLFTGYGQLVGTPLYMSPEQAQMSELDVDTRSDVYSLGVLLYELLTGTTPFDSETLRRAGFDEMRRMIREDEPLRPSARVSTLQGELLSTVASRRNVDPRKLGRHLHGDLDWIVMQALEKDRSRRYESANDFAADVQRYLNDEPIEARPPSRGYKLRKFMRRNKGPVLAAAAIIVTLFGGIVGTTVGLIRATEAEAEAKFDAARATKAEHRARDLLIAERAARTELISVQTREVQQRAQASAATEAALAEAERLQSQANWAQALAAVQRAKSLLKGSEDRDELQRRVQELAGDLELVARLVRVRTEAKSQIAGDGFSDYWSKAVGGFDYAGADREYARAVREFGIDPTNVQSLQHIRSPSLRVELAAALDDWATARRRCVKEDEHSWKQLVEAARIIDPDPWRNQLRQAWAENDRDALEQLAESAPVDDLPPATLVLLGTALEYGGGHQRAFALLLKAHRKYPDDFWINYGLGHCAGKLHWAGSPHQLREAIRFYTAALALRPDNPSVHKKVGRILVEQGKLAEGITEFKEALRLKPDFLPAYVSLAWTLATFPDPAQRDGAQAVKYAHKALELRPQESTHWSNLGVAYYAAGEYPKAVETLEKADQMRNGRDDWHRFFLAMAHWQLGNQQQARKYYHQGVQWIEREAANMARGSAEEQIRFRAEAEKLMGSNKQKSDVSDQRPGVGNGDSENSDR